MPPQLPSLSRMVWNFAVAKARHALMGGGYVTEAQARIRLDICEPCEQRVDNRCAACGCYLDVVEDSVPGKAHYPPPVGECPLGRWPAISA